MTGEATYVSPPSQAIPTTAPGATGPGSTIGVDKAAITLIILAVGGLVGLRLVFGKKGSLPPMRVDASEAVKIWLAYQTINVPLKVICYKYYGHQAAQAYLLLA